MNTSSSKGICERLKKTRISAGYRSARAFAIAHNVPYITYSQHEVGKRKTNPETIIKYAEYLNIDPAWLLTGKAYNEQDHTALGSEEPDFLKSAPIYQKEKNDPSDIDAETISEIFDQITTLVGYLNIDISDKDKIFLSVEIYKRTFSTSGEKKSPAELFDVISYSIKHLLKKKVA